VSVRPSVCAIYRPLQQRVAGLLLWAVQARDINQSTAAWPVLSSNCEQYNQLMQEAKHRLVSFSFRH